MFFIVSHVEDRLATLAQTGHQLPVNLILADGASQRWPFEHSHSSFVLPSL